MGGFAKHSRGPGGMRLLLEVVWKVAMRDESLKALRMACWVKLQTGEAAVAVRRVAAARAVCRNNIGRMMEAMFRYGSG